MTSIKNKTKFSLKLAAVFYSFNFIMAFFVLKPLGMSLLTVLLAILYFVLPAENKKIVDQHFKSISGQLKEALDTATSLSILLIVMPVFIIALLATMLEVSEEGNFTTPDFPGVVCEKFEEAKGIIILSKCVGEDSEKTLYTTRVMEINPPQNFGSILEKALLRLFTPEDRKDFRIRRIF